MNPEPSNPVRRAAHSGGQAPIPTVTASPLAPPSPLIRGHYAHEHVDCPNSVMVLWEQHR